MRTCVLHEGVCPAKRTVAPNYGGRVPVDTTPGPAPVCRALKIHPSFQLLRPTAGTGRCCITATSTTVDELREDIDHGICRCTQRACNDTCTTDVDHLVNVLQLENLNDHGDLPVRNDRDVDDNDELQLRRVHSLQSEGQKSTSASESPLFTSESVKLFQKASKTDTKHVSAVETRRVNTETFLESSPANKQPCTPIFLYTSGRTARGVETPETSLYMPQQMYFRSVPANMPSIRGLPTREGTQHEVHSNQQYHSETSHCNGPSGPYRPCHPRRGEGMPSPSPRSPSPRRQPREAVMCSEMRNTQRSAPSGLLGASVSSSRTGQCRRHATASTPWNRRSSRALRHEPFDERSAWMS